MPRDGGLKPYTTRPAHYVSLPSDPGAGTYIRLSSVWRVPRELRSTATLLPFRRGVCAQSRPAKGRSWDGEALLPVRERTPYCEPRRVRPCSPVLASCRCARRTAPL